MNQLKQKRTEWITERSISLDFLSEEPPASLHRKVPLGDRHKTLIVIPSFNEEASIGQVLEDVKQNAPGIPVLVINDGSVDQTAQVAEEHGARVISLPYNSGYERVVWVVSASTQPRWCRNFSSNELRRYEGTFFSTFTFLELNC